MTNARIWLLVVGIFASGLGACQPGYIKADELERKEQGPSHCAARCQELHMKMGALVLVGDQLPGCVCQPVEQKVGIGALGAQSSNAADEGASAATTSYAVVLAAAAAAQQIRQQQQAQQQQQSTVH